MSREFLEAVYQNLLSQREGIKLGSVEDERLDAQLCLMEKMLESAGWLS